MADAAVDSPANVPAPFKKQPTFSSIPNVESLEGISNDDSDEYATMKKLQRHIEYIQLQEEYIKDEQRYPCSNMPLPRYQANMLSLTGVSSANWSEPKRRLSEYRVSRSSSANSWKP